MLSRALSLATVALLIGCFSAKPTQAQNLEAGKSPSQIFAGTCNACHKSPRGLLRTVPAGSLPSFLREHYTTSSEMASLLSSFLVSNGAADTRYAQPKQAKEGKPEARPGGPPDQLDRFGRRLRPAASPQEAARPDAEPREAARPDVDGIAPRGRKRLARPGETPAADGLAPAQAAIERGPDGRKLSAKQRLSKRGRPGGEEPPKSEAAKTDAGKDEPAKGEAAKDDQAKGETAKDEGSKPEGAKPEGTKPSGESSSESAKVEAPKETGGDTPVLRADPVPPVTPAPNASPAVSAAVSSATPEPPAAGPSEPSEPPPTTQPAPPAVTASVPPPPTIAPAGPPAPPISQ
jgi:hypothetical protein